MSLRHLSRRAIRLPAIAALLAQGIAAHGEVLTVPGHARVELQAPAFGTKRGSLIAWVMPLWEKDDGNSHTFVTLRWQGEDQSYLALSHGWWEPAGSRKLYFVLSNQDFAFCEMPGQFDYSIFAKHQWTMLAATWAAGKPGYVRLFVDGEKICERRIDFDGERRAAGRIFIGSDLGATDQRNRAADFLMDRLEFSQAALTEGEIRDRYRRGGGAAARKWVDALLDEQSRQSPRRETRAMFDEDTHWVGSRAETDETLRRVKQAGFNAYVPCIWNGAQAEFDTHTLPVSKAFSARAAKNDDPLDYLMAAAHKNGIAVHLWFDIARRDTRSLPLEYSEGAPPGAFNVQNAAFRGFITQAITGAAARYDPDGINVDYIRSMGVCASRTCEDDYGRRYGRSLREDWVSAENGASIPSLVEWNAKAVSGIVDTLSAHLRSRKPAIFLSADTVPFDHSRLDQGVDVAGWIASGAVDAIVYMAYESPLDVARITEAWSAIPHDKLLIAMRNFVDVGNRYADLSGAETESFARLVRSQWAGAGVGFYHYPHLTAEQVAALEMGAFALPAANGWLRSDR